MTTLTIQWDDDKIPPYDIAEDLRGIAYSVENLDTEGKWNGLKWELHE